VPEAPTATTAEPRLPSVSVHVDNLETHPQNARRGDVQKITASLRRHGQYRPIVVQRRTGYVLAGNHTLMSARRLGWEHLDVVYVDVDDEEARRILLADNRTSDLAAYEDGALALLLAEVPDLEGTGYDGENVDVLLAQLAPAPSGGATILGLEQLTAEAIRGTAESAPATAPAPPPPAREERPLPPPVEDPPPPADPPRPRATLVTDCPQCGHTWHPELRSADQ